jgi:zinc/manganese transport system ATP-binding protein
MTLNNLKKYNVDDLCEVICKDISFSYNNYNVLECVTGTFPSSSMNAIVGPNGCGKTTLIKIIGGQLKGYSGLCYRKEGDNSSQLKEIQQTAYMSQLKEIDSYFPLTVFDVAAQGLLLKAGFNKRLSSEHKDEVMDTLHSLSMSSYASSLLSDLSGGQRQRVFFARLSLQKASVILLDEPFAAVDPYTLDELLEYMYNWQRNGANIIMVSHDLDVVRSHFQRTLLLVKRPVAWGNTSDVLSMENMRAAKSLARSLRL